MKKQIILLEYMSLRHTKNKEGSFYEQITKPAHRQVKRWLSTNLTSAWILYEFDQSIAQVNS